MGAAVHHDPENLLRRYPGLSRRDAEVIYARIEADKHTYPPLSETQQKNWRRLSGSAGAAGETAAGRAPRPA